MVSSYMYTARQKLNGRERADFNGFYLLAISDLLILQTSVSLHEAKELGDGSRRQNEQNYW